MRCIVLLRIVLPVTVSMLIGPPAPGADLDQLIATVNARLEAAGADHRLIEIAPLLAPGGRADRDDRRIGAAGGGNWRTVKSPHYDFVPADPRRGGRTDITYAFDRVDLTITGVEPAVALQAIQRAVDTFDDEACAGGLVLTKVPDTATDLGVMEFLHTSYGGAPGPIADITHAGWLPAPFFDLTAAPGWCDHVLGYTATFVFTDADGKPTDLDRNGLRDVFFREAYYNQAFDWSVDYDVFTVALHETGHLLGNHHEGWALTDDDMVPARYYQWDEAYVLYHGVHDRLDQKERSDFCSNWRQWPER